MGLTLPIVVGRSYVRRDGVVVVAAEAPNQSGRIDTQGGAYVSRKTGRFDENEYADHALDLVADAINTPSAMPAIQVGQVWRTRGGAEVEVLDVNSDEDEWYPVHGSDGISRGKDGRELKTGYADQPLDFVQLLRGPGSSPPMAPLQPLPPVGSPWPPVAPAPPPAVPPAKAHPHAALMLLYAQDAAETDKPWERWEMRVHPSYDWAELRRNPDWTDVTQYRRKVKTIRIGEFDVPEPLRVAPAHGTYCTVPNLLRPDRKSQFVWTDTAHHRAWLAQSIVHVDDAAAEQHAEALLSLTKSPPKP